MNIAFRFGVDQGAKIRACDDLRHARTNLACVVGAPIKLVRWGPLFELSDLANRDDRDWRFCKADHEASYKQLPLLWEHAVLSAIALRSPVDKRWYGSSAALWSLGHWVKFSIKTCFRAYSPKFRRISSGFLFSASSMISGPSARCRYRRQLYKLAPAFGQRSVFSWKFRNQMLVGESFPLASRATSPSSETDSDLPFPCRLTKIQSGKL